MTISVGDKLPDVKLVKATEGGPEQVSSSEYFKGKKVALFSVPGAFTPTCSARHLPGYVEKAEDLKAKGVDEIAGTIRRIGQEAGVPIHSDPPTARAIHASVEVGDEISEELYAPVAAAIRFAEDMRVRAKGRVGS